MLLLMIIVLYICMTVKVRTTSKMNLGLIHWLKVWAYDAELVIRFGLLFLTV